MRKRTVALLLLLAAATLLAALAPVAARAGYGISPNGRTFEVSVDRIGSVAAPSSIPVVVYLDSLDGDAVVYVSTSPTWNDDGSPTGPLVGMCVDSLLQPSDTPNTYVCNVDTALLRTGVAYHWWMAFRRHDDGGRLGRLDVSGPFEFTLVAKRTPPASTATRQDAPRLPASARFTGERSIKDTTVTGLVYRTMKQITTPRMLAVACWTNDDFEAMLAAAGISGVQGAAEVTGAWFVDEPRWLHLRGTECTWLQRLIDRKVASGKTAFALANTLHEAMHAYGLMDEAQVNCYAVQLVPASALLLGLPPRRADYLRKLALDVVRRSSPAGYWDPARCRDGGSWDLKPEQANLR